MAININLDSDDNLDVSSENFKVFEKDTVTKIFNIYDSNGTLKDIAGTTMYFVYPGNSMICTNNGTGIFNVEFSASNLTASEDNGSYEIMWNYDTDKNKTIKYGTYYVLNSNK